MTILSLAHKVREEIGLNNTKKALSLLNTALIGKANQNTVLVRAAQHYGLKKEIIQGTIGWERVNLTQNQIHAALLKVVDEIVDEEVKGTKVFVSYNREVVCANLAKSIRLQLKEKGFHIFMDVEDTPIGADWAKTILQEISTCHYFIVLLSEKANTSEMVIKEVEEATRRKQKEGNPIILPVRVNFSFEKRLNARLHSLLYRVQQLEWNSSKDTNTILNKITDVLFGRVDIVIDSSSINEEAAEKFVLKDDIPPTPVAPLEIPRGAVRLESKYYIKRPQEDLFIKHIEAPGALLRIRGPRQFGKTSLLTRVIAHAAELDYTIITIDFQEFDDQAMSNLDQFLWEFTSYFAEELDLEDELEKRWRRPRAKKQTCTSFIEKEILRKQEKPILLALDEADRLFHYKDVSTEFFLLLRSWHEKSKVPNKREWENFHLVLSYSTEAKLAIQDLNASPFNVGEEAKLVPFSKDQVVELTHRHGLHWNSEELDYIMMLLEGQPYLVRRLMYLLAKEEYTYEEIVEKAHKHDGPFSDHLRHHLINIKQFNDAVDAMEDILDKGKCKDPIMATRLEATGLVKGTPPDVILANGLYATYFKGKL